MDGSFLSDVEVIDESRKFVCIRLATYENKEEAALLKSIFIGRSGELENTTFAILSPDGKRQLVRSGRSPDFAFRSIGTMATTMRRISSQYGARGANTELPVMSDVRLAINVASCDNQPLIVLRATNQDRLAELKARMSTLAWSDEFIGQFLYVATTDSADLKAIRGLQASSEIIVVEPGHFGIDGDVLAQLKGDASDADLQEALDVSVVLHQRVDKQMATHTRLGSQLGIQWKTALPVTDPGGPGRGGPGRGGPPGRRPRGR
jgi:hypothetical protein